MATRLKRKISKTSLQKKASSSSLRSRRLHIARPDVMSQYLRHRSINQYLEYVNQRFSSFVQLYNIGTSYEGRRMRAIEIDWNCDRNRRALWKKNGHLPHLNPNRGTTRDVIFIEGGSHGREWLSISVALNIVHQLTEKHYRNMILLKRFRFFIVPVSNPDGYEYTHNHNVNWRKNRRPTSPSCKNIGIDCNRNYDYQWDAGTDKESSCLYKGEKPFSECETRAMRRALQRFQPNLLLFMSLHSYAQSIMYPWGYTEDRAVNARELQAIALAGSEAIKKFSGRFYRTGSISELCKHPIGGSIVDYAYAVHKVPFSYVLELPDANYGFQPPAHFIRPVGEETWVGITKMCDCAHKLQSNPHSRDVLLQNLQKNYVK